LREYISAFESLFKPLGNVIPRSPEEMSRQEKRLVQGGFRRKDAAVLFHGAQFGLILLFIAIVLLVLPGSAPIAVGALSVLVERPCPISG